MSLFGDKEKKDPLAGFNAAEMSKRSDAAKELHVKEGLIQEELLKIKASVERAVEVGCKNVKYTSEAQKELLDTVLGGVEDWLWANGFELREDMVSRVLLIDWENPGRRNTDYEATDGTPIHEGDWLDGTYKNDEHGDSYDIVGQVYYDVKCGGFCIDPEMGIPLYNMGRRKILTENEVKRINAEEATEKLGE